MRRKRHAEVTVNPRQGLFRQSYALGKDETEAVEKRGLVAVGPSDSGPARAMAPAKVGYPPPLRTLDGPWPPFLGLLAAVSIRFPCGPRTAGVSWPFFMC